MFENFLGENDRVASIFFHYFPHKLKNEQMFDLSYSTLVTELKDELDKYSLIKCSEHYKLSKIKKMILILDFNFSQNVISFYNGENHVVIELLNLISTQQIVKMILLYNFNCLKLAKFIKHIQEISRKTCFFIVCTSKFVLFCVLKTI